MGLVDLVLGALLGAFALRGFWRGMFHEAMAVVAVVAACAVAFALAAPVGAWMVERFAAPGALAKAAGFFAVFFPLLAAIRLTRMIATRFMPGLKESSVNALGGLFLGTLKGAVVLGAVVALLRVPVSLPDVAYAESLRETVLNPVERFQAALGRSVLATGMAGMSLALFSIVVETNSVVSSREDVARP